VPALVRYISSTCLASQRWVAPGLVYLLCISITYAAGGGALGTLAIGAVCLFPVTAWVGVATLNEEDLSQMTITAAAAGGLGRARLARLLAAAAVGLCMTAVSLAAAAATNASSVTAGELAAGAAAHALAVVAGVALASLCARPLVTRAGWALFAIVLATIADLVVPYAPPARIVLSALGGGQEVAWRTLALGGLAAVVLSAAAVSVSTAVSLRRA
jgi:hypothetical protein